MKQWCIVDVASGGGTINYVIEIAKEEDVIMGKQGLSVTGDLHGDGSQYHFFAAARLMHYTITEPK